MGEYQLVYYPRRITCSLRNSVCCVLAANLFFPIKSSPPNHNQNMACGSPFLETVAVKNLVRAWQVKGVALPKSKSKICNLYK